MTNSKRVSRVADLVVQFAADGAEDRLYSMPRMRNAEDTHFLCPQTNSDLVIV